MKKLLVMALVLMVAGGAVAYEYQGCVDRVGLFFSSNYEFDDQRMEDATNINYTPFVPFEMHVVMVNVSQAFDAYELAIVGLPAEVLSTGAVFPNAINFGGSNLNHIVGFGAPRTGSGQSMAALLSTVTLLFTGATAVPLEIGIAPSVPSSIGNDGPAIVRNQSTLWRINFTPYTHSGCEADLAPGDFPDYVATAYGEGIVINTPVPTQSHTLTNVKSLFR
jgi:hypothetical protein